MSANIGCINVGPDHFHCRYDHSALSSETMLSPVTSPFEDALAALRISGSVLLHECYRPPWAIEVPDERQLQKLLGAKSDVRVLPFHLVRHGSFVLHHDGLEPIDVETNDVVICTGGKRHRMAFGAKSEAVSLADILSGEADRREVASVARDKRTTELICGVFLLRSVPLNPMLAALPPVLKLRTAGDDASPLLMRVAESLGEELALGHRSSFTALRLLEVFCAAAISQHRRAEGQHLPGWFKALDDPKIGSAMARIHQNPGAPWTVALLAEAVAMSPSRFAARFRETTRQSAMAYVTRWRMSVACRLLRETELALPEIAAEIGYQDTAAFSRAFKALVGQSPSPWRQQTRLRSNTFPAA
ncbi:AraC family transcriptional regulator [Bradyrhizobium sediminis]|uniref:AraC family transcriptional regulator n=1 Tax=Bradyrhizobium sediminis TaxID=2840469 RepID=A0A975NTU5_9BRAD|nr:AraC family transcriptional regulator [Bradyrhizobium sediminis]QWG19939.1 AraC family transcriptional regulator [Bradyrhizobium sediminis]